MSQSSYIAAFLLIGFVVFITMRGELLQYKAILLGGSPATAAAVPNSAATGTPQVQAGGGGY